MPDKLYLFPLSLFALSNLQDYFTFARRSMLRRIKEKGK